MTSFQVVPAELTSASGLIGSAASCSRRRDGGRVRRREWPAPSAASRSRAPFSAACGRAAQAIIALTTTMGTLAGCVQAAAEGYLVTDHGIIPASGVPGAVTPNNPSGGGPRRSRRPGAGHDQRRRAPHAGGHRAVPGPTQGSPGEIRSAAASLRLAAEDLQTAHGTLGDGRRHARQLGGPGRAGLPRVRQGWPRSCTAEWPACTPWPRSCCTTPRRSTARSRASAPAPALRRRRAPGASTRPGLVTAWPDALPKASKSERGRLIGLIIGAARAAQTDVTRPTVTPGTRSACSRTSTARRAPMRRARAVRHAAVRRQLGQPDRSPRPRLRAGSSRWLQSSVLAPFSGVIPLHAAPAQGPVGVRPDHGRRAAGQRDGDDGRAAHARRCCSGTASARAAASSAGSRAASGRAGVAKTIAGDGSVGSAAVGTVEALPGAGLLQAAHEGEALVNAGETASASRLLRHRRSHQEGGRRRASTGWGNRLLARHRRDLAGRRVAHRTSRPEPSTRRPGRASPRSSGRSRHPRRARRRSGVGRAPGTAVRVRAAAPAAGVDRLAAGARPR